MSNNDKIDNDSYAVHDEGYSRCGLDWQRQRFEEYEKQDIFSKIGFKEIIEKNPALREIHIDIGCGAGWLLNKTAPIFKKVIAIEPSKAAVDIAKEITKEYKNIEFVNLPMIEAVKSLNLQNPCLFTTSAVLSHIGDEHVKKFLEILSGKAPINSVLYFCECYDKNIQVPLWHIRRKKWWRENLPNWELTFRGIKDDGYCKGISGKHIGHSIAKAEENNIFFDTWWDISGVYYKFRFGLPRIIRKIIKKLK